VPVDQEAAGAYRKLAAADPARYWPDLAAVLSNLSGELGELGRHAQALMAADESVSMYKKLARADAATYSPALASALTNLSIAYVGVGRASDAIGSSREGVTVYRRLAAASPGYYDTALADSLDNLAHCLNIEALNQSIGGRAGKARKLREEAAKIRVSIDRS
jgi:tetratricopeptide (TPR) repeat protein